jgi:D-tagatose-1,6-bisphosphate aldolase subunit GatZ/KbaZ
MTHNNIRPSQSTTLSTRPGEVLARLRDDHLTGRRGGEFAVCSANRFVLAAAMHMLIGQDGHLLVEATANQVNQYGGYMGMTPADFCIYIDRLAGSLEIDGQRVLLGADHLGPHVWRDQPAAIAMAKAMELARHYVTAGFVKLHLDASMRCIDDPPNALLPATIARRTALLCQAAEGAAAKLPPAAPRPLYVIGTEVPPPGGGLTDTLPLQVTRPQDVAEMIELTQQCFDTSGLQDAWRRVIGMVVQPGVEFGDEHAMAYDPHRAVALSDYHQNLPGLMTYEVHATDYQPPNALRALVKDHYTILKVGPSLSNAVREAIFSLAQIEVEWLTRRQQSAQSHLREIIEQVMQQNPAYWQSHYQGTPQQLRMLRAFSLRDRIRYYWRHPKVATALKQLLNNLQASMPSSLLSQYFPDIYPSALATGVEPSPDVLIRLRVQRTLKPYQKACGTPLPGS